MSDPVGDAKKAVGILSELKTIAGDNPDVKAGALEAAKSFKTATTFINNALLPLVAVNWTIQKAKDFFQGGHFEEEMRPKVSSIPFEFIVEPKASIAGPAMQALSFSIDEPTLKEMYLNLIAKAMDGRNSSNAHPAFVEIIKQMTAEEAKLFPKLLHRNGFMAIAQIRDHETPPGLGPSAYVTLEKHIMNLGNVEPESRPSLKLLRSYIDNWVRLGLVDVTYENSLSDQESYNWIQELPEFKNPQNRSFPFGSIIVHKGIIEITAFGKNFMSVVGIT